MIRVNSPYNWHLILLQILEVNRKLWHPYTYNLGTQTKVLCPQHTLLVDIHKPLWWPWSKKSLHTSKDQRECENLYMYFYILYNFSIDWPITSFSLSLFPSLRLWPGTSSILNINLWGRRGWMNYKSARYINQTYFICEQIGWVSAFCMCECLLIINVMSLPMQQMVWMSHTYHAAIWPYCPFV